MNKDGKFRTLNPGKFWLFASATLALLAGSTAVQAEELGMLSESQPKLNLVHIGNEDIKEFYFNGTEFELKPDGYLEASGTFLGDSYYHDKQKNPNLSKNTELENHLTDFYFVGEEFNLKPDGYLEASGTFFGEGSYNGKKSNPTEQKEPQLEKQSPSKAIKDTPSGESTKTKKYVFVKQDSNDLGFQSLENARRFEKSWMAATILEGINTRSKFLDSNKNKLISVDFEKFEKLIEDAKASYSGLSGNKPFTKEDYLRSKTIREKLAKAILQFNV